MNKNNFTTEEEVIDFTIKTVVNSFLQTKSPYVIFKAESEGEFKGEILLLLWAKTGKRGREFNIQFCSTPEIPSEYMERLVEAFDKSGAISDIILNGNNFCNISKRPLSDWLDAINNNLNILDMPYIKFAA